MERKIHLLPLELTLKIAAGEVIERPASILKELLENALDAGATVIRVELSKGGCDGIRIEDNGRGIPREEAPLAFERFATSKIDAFDDLYGVASYGFRGEALPSIAAIARVEMVTRTKDALSGTRLIAQGGRIQEISEVGCPIGTSISVTQIFDNVPVRKKFLKSEATEQGYCLDVLHRAALANEKIKIDVLANNRQLLSIPATSRTDERVALILGQEARDHLLPISGFRDDGLRLQGFISRPEWNRSSAKHLYCFINRRYVKDPLINHAVMTAYRNVMEAKRYPVAILHLELPAGAVDVNVHPAKMEVRFLNPRDIYGLVVESALHGLSGVTPEPAAPGSPGPSLPAAGYQARVEEALKRYHLRTGEAKLSFSSQPPSKPSPLPPQQPSFASMEAPAAEAFGGPTLEKVVFCSLSYLGQASGTYLVFAGPEGLVLLDQHAAHERILFESLRSHVATGGMISQQLLMPEIVNLTERDYEVISGYLDLFRDMGLEMEPFGDNTLIVKAIPAMLPDLDPRALIRDILDDAAGMEHSPHLQKEKDGLMALLACRGAVKANHPLSLPEVAALCRDLDQTPFASTCPHGRPTYVPISRKELDRLFKRK